MQWISTNELREKFLNFFESKNHLKHESFPLIPNGDNSLLLINSGMAPMKKYFTNEVTPPSKRIVTCQKCIRTPDIERVGISARHGTFFEMLGNFSFGDYFKEEAIIWAWEFLTKVLEIEKEKLWVSVYKDDDETVEIWTSKTDVDKNHIVKLGKEDNFWEHGKGPCGPCSEIYFDRGEKYSCGKANCAVGCDCDRYVEVWNLVFSQFFNDGKENYTKLKQTNIDTGMGLERLACVMQGADNLFMIDTVQNIIKEICKIAKVTYGENNKKDIAIRVIADHARSITFMASDGIVASNEGRGYVFRRLLRRAARFGRLLGIKKAFLDKIAKVVINESKCAYPELKQNEEYIIKLIKTEEANFAKTIDQGLSLLQKIINLAKENKQGFISGEDAFKLNDTYGFPIDSTREIARENNLTIDEKTFSDLLLKQKTMARNARKNAGAEAWLDKNLNFKNIDKTNFTGYEENKTNTKVLAIVRGSEQINKASANEEVIIITSKTPFYAQSGGQVGDTGVIEADNFKAKVINTTKDESGHFLHFAKITDGSIKLGEQVKLIIDENRRKNIMRNHTAAHILQAALKKVLGEHVSQAGQLVDENEVRFDFKHFSAVEFNELEKIEELVNKEILKAININTKIMNLNQAKESGAIALFSEKYEDKVRVVSLEDGFSSELCGGTHVDNTSKIVMFKIISESSVAAGVRRIQAITGEHAIKLATENFNIVKYLTDKLKVNDKNKLPQTCNELLAQIKESKREIEDLKAKAASAKLASFTQNASEINGIKIIAQKLENTSVDTAKTISDQLKNQFENSIIFFAVENKEKANLLCSVSKKAQSSRVNAANIVKEAAKIADGKGGGKPGFAMAGVKDISKLSEIISSIDSIIKASM